MFDTLSGLARMAVGVATLPVTVAADLATCGGIVTDQDETYTGKQVRQIGEALDDAIEGGRK